MALRWNGWKPGRIVSADVEILAQSFDADIVKMATPFLEEFSGLHVGDVYFGVAVPVDLLDKHQRCESVIGPLCRIARSAAPWGGEYVMDAKGSVFFYPCFPGGEDQGQVTPVYCLGQNTDEAIEVMVPGLEYDCPHIVDIPAEDSHFNLRQPSPTK